MLKDPSPLKSCMVRQVSILVFLSYLSGLLTEEILRERTGWVTP
jgi:hypothetical protein